MGIHNVEGVYKSKTVMLTSFFHDHSQCTITVEPPIKDPLRKGQPPYKGHSSGPVSHSSSIFLTHEKRTTSQQRTKWLIPRCPRVTRLEGVHLA